MTRRRRSALYVPASNPRVIEKVRSLPCDVVILDLEDAVAPEAKATARAYAVEALRAGGFGSREIVVRVNALDTPWGPDDLEAIAQEKADAILVPKIATPESLEPYERALHGRGQFSLWLMIETALSILRLDAICSFGVRCARLACLVAGTNDLAKEAGFLPGGPERLPLQAPLALLVLAARAHGLAALDGVYNALDDADGLAAQCAQARAFGFDGKTLIHPGQIEACHRAFTPDAAAVAAARAIVAAFEAPENAGKGALRVEGQMVELLHLAQARRTLALVESLEPPEPSRPAPLPLR